MEPSFELFDHTADVGIRVQAGSLAGLVQPAMEGLYAVLGEVVAGVETGSIPFDLTGDGAAVLLRDYLAEVLFLFERDQRKVVSADVTIFEDTRLALTAQMASIDREKSSYHREVKAVTYHELVVRNVPGGFEAVYIVDI